MKRQVSKPARATASHPEEYKREALELWPASGRSAAKIVTELGGIGPPLALSLGGFWSPTKCLEERVQGRSQHHGAGSGDACRKRQTFRAAREVSRKSISGGFLEVEKQLPTRLAAKRPLLLGEDRLLPGQLAAARVEGDPFRLAINSKFRVLQVHLSGSGSGGFLTGSLSSDDCSNSRSGQPDPGSTPGHCGNDL
jgi:hypothetical protein